jgi:hypothetical protein
MAVQDGLLGSNANIPDFLQSFVTNRGATFPSLMANINPVVPAMETYVPRVYKGAVGLFDQLGTDGDSQTDPPPSASPPSNNVDYNMSRFTEELTNPVNAAQTLGGLFGLAPIPGLGLIGSAIGAYSGSKAVDEAIAQSQGWNPDVSAFDQFLNAITFGTFGKSGAQQLQEEVDAFSGIDGLFDAEEDKLMTEAERQAIERGSGKFGGPSDALQEAITQSKIDQATILDLEDVTSIDDGYDAGSDFGDDTTAAEQESEMSE